MEVLWLEAFGKYHWKLFVVGARFGKLDESRLKGICGGEKSFLKQEISSNKSFTLNFLLIFLLLTRQGKSKFLHRLSGK